MTLTLELLGGLSLLELLLWLPGLRRLRKPLASIGVVGLAVVNGALIAERPTLGASLILLVSVYRALNLLRVVEARMHESYLRRTVLRTSLWLIGLQVLIGLLWQAWQFLPSSVVFWLGLVAGLQLALAGIIGVSTIRHISHAKQSKTVLDTAGGWPSLTVAIPARNETTDLQECLKTVIASDYPKLEVIVLDDCSQTPKTAEVIRSFAHDGVKFIKSDEPDSTWLAKNQAYERLREEANGELILFCGVDVRFEPDSIRRLVRTMSSRHKTMISVIPRNELPRSFKALLIQPMRYAWELSLPRKLFKRPPVLSTCWLVQRELLQRAGGFTAVRRMIVPESYFARNSAREADGYGFIASAADLGVMSVKTAEEQQATAVRTRYPQLHRRPEQVLVVALAEIVFLLGPIILFVGMLWLHAWVLVGVSALSCALLEISYLAVVRLAYQTLPKRSFWTLPAAVILNIGLLHTSMWRYEFSEVIWKGRNICLPVMHVVPHLPNPER